jgi:serine/threonine protein kinase
MRKESMLFKSTELNKNIDYGDVFLEDGAIDNIASTEYNLSAQSSFVSKDTPVISDKTKGNCKCSIILQNLKSIDNKFLFKDLDDMIKKIENFDTNELKLLAIEIYNALYQINDNAETSSLENTPDTQDQDIKAKLKIKRTNSTWRQVNENTVDELYHQKIDDYTLIDEIGKGSQAVVYLALNNKNKNIYAIKAIKYKTISCFKVKWISLVREISIMKFIKCKNIVKLHEVIEDKKNKIAYLVMDYIPGGAFLKCIDFKNKRYETFSKEKIFKYTKQIVYALKILHKNNIIHRDLKPENILVDYLDNIYLTDFGVSEIVKGKNIYTNVDRCGTAMYFSPELLMESSVKGAPLDVWALGVIMFLMTFGYFPFDADNVSDLKEKIITHDPNYPPNISNEERDFFSKILYKDPQRRMTLSRILKHPLFKNEFTIVHDDSNDQSNNISNNTSNNESNDESIIESTINSSTETGFININENSYNDFMNNSNLCIDSCDKYEESIGSSYYLSRRKSSVYLSPLKPHSPNFKPNSPLSKRRSTAKPIDNTSSFYAKLPVDSIPVSCGSSCKLLSSNTNE